MIGRFNINVKKANIIRYHEDSVIYLLRSSDR